MLGQESDLGIIRQLRTVPNAHNPNCLPDNPIEKPVRPDDDFAVGKFRKFGKGAAGIRKLLQPSKGRLGFKPKFLSGSRTILANVFQALQELFTG